jgi:N-acetylmuramoyl-L-alanine amidase
VRFPILLSLGLFSVVGILIAQQPDDEAERKKSFLNAREQMRIVPPTTPAPEPPPKPKPRITPETPKPVPEPEPTPKPPAPRATPGVTPRPKPRAQPTPFLVITPKPGPNAPPPESDSAPQVTVKKSGFEDAEVVPAEKEKWSWFGGGAKYKYLSKGVRDAIDDAPVRRNRWRYIVVHNSGTRQGSARAFDYYHKRVRKMQNGLAYHFVIGNGSATGDGAVEIGSRWTRQINGGHVHSDYLNNIALGICLVGDYNRDVPTMKQREALDELIKYLRKRVGKVEGKPSRVEPHRAVNPPRWATDCPGDKFPYSWLRGFN